MSLVGTVTRRGFLIGSSAIAGGVAFGIHAVRSPGPNPLKDDLLEGEATFNPWVKISSSGITLIAPHTDMGQGIRSLQALLIAEELDVELNQCNVEVGTVSSSYWNRGLADDALPFLPWDRGATAETMRLVANSAVKLIGMQVTGGSASTPDSYEKLRLAGAIARETIKLAASKRSGVSVSELKTAHGQVIFPDGAKINYQDLAVDAANINPVTQVVLRDPSQWKLIGKPTRRIDIKAKSTGTANYGIDLVQKGMLHATVRINPYKGGERISFDAFKAKVMPGVKKILEVTNGVAVVANNTWNAFQAIDAIDIKWAKGPYPQNMDAHWQTLRDSLVESRLDSRWRDEGDIATALSQGEVAQFEYKAPYVAHAPLEPLNAIILMTDDSADIWTSHQIPAVSEQKVAVIAGLPTDKVRIHNQYCGGSFGHRLEFESIVYAAEIAVQMKGIPIKLTFKREEDFAQDHVRQIGMAKAQGIVTKGKVEALDISVVSPSVTASQTGRMGMSISGPDSQIPAGIWTTPYAIPNLRVSAYKAPELAPVSSWRSVGASIGGFFLESAMDELIYQAGADPLKERIRLCSFDVARKTLELVGQLSNWDSPLGPKQGRGVAMIVSFGVLCLLKCSPNSRP